MNSITTLCIFIVILFLYIHIANQFKKSDDLEIYETDFTSTKHLEDVCELKQPVLMNMVNIVMISCSHHHASVNRKNLSGHVGRFV